MNKSDKEEEERPGPIGGALVIVKYGYCKSVAVNPNAGLLGIMETIRESLRAVGIPDTDHIELCDENGKLINPNDFPPMMLLSAFVKPESEEVCFIPVRVERDGRQVLKLEPLLADAEKIEPEMMQRMRKENHIARDRPGQKGESSFSTKSVFPEEGSQPANSSGSAHAPKSESKKVHGSKLQK